VNPEPDLDEVLGSLSRFDTEDLGDWQRTRPRNVSAEDMQRYEKTIREIFTAFGMDVGTPGTERTPARFLQALYDATEGYEGDPKLMTAFPTECHGGPDCELSQVVEGPIPFYALCEHHAFPFFGHAYVGYVAHEQIIGISKLTRVVRLYAQRFTVQERIGQQVVETLEEILRPAGVAVYLEAHHLCTMMRGVRGTSAETRTTFWRGEYADNAALRTEFFTACGLQR
jgi:GTP cyclohydrolase I